MLTNGCTVRYIVMLQHCIALYTVKQFINKQKQVCVCERVFLFILLLVSSVLRGIPLIAFIARNYQKADESYNSHMTRSTNLDQSCFMITILFIDFHSIISTPK